MLISLHCTTNASSFNAKLNTFYFKEINMSDSKQHTGDNSNQENEISFTKRGNKFVKQISLSLSQAIYADAESKKYDNFGDYIKVLIDAARNLYDIPEPFKSALQKEKADMKLGDKDYIAYVLTTYAIKMVEKNKGR